MSQREQLVEWRTRLGRVKRHPKLERAAGSALVAVSAAFLSLYVIKSWPEIRPYLSHINLWLLAAGQLCTLVALFLGALMWALIQQGAGLGFSWQEGIAIHLKSGITKYIPGYAWQYLSKAYLSRKRNAPAKNIMLAMLTELILLIIGGVALAAVWGTVTSYRQQIFESIPTGGWWFIAVVSVLGAALAIVLFSRLTAINRQIHSWAALGLAFLGWMVLALAAWLIARSVYPVPIRELSQFVPALVFSSIISLLVIFVPGGLGVRETALAFLLSGSLPMAIAVLVSILVRLSIIIAEVLGFILVVRLLPSKNEISPE